MHRLQDAHGSLRGLQLPTEPDEPKEERIDDDPLQATRTQGAQSHGLVVYNLFVGAEVVTPAVRRTVLSALPRCVLLAETERPTGLYLAGRAPSLVQALADEETANQASGVERVQLNLFLRHTFAADRVEGWIDEQLAMWGRARPAR